MNLSIYAADVKSRQLLVQKIGGINSFRLPSNGSILHPDALGTQWLSGRVLDSRPKGGGFEPYRRHCIVSLSKNINPNLELVQPRKTRPFITERLLMGRKESKQTKTNIFMPHVEMLCNGK